MYIFTVHICMLYKNTCNNIYVYINKVRGTRWVSTLQATYIIKIINLINLVKQAMRLVNCV